MPSLKSDAIRMRHMLDATRKALLFVENKPRSELDKDEKLSLALVRLIEIVGEAASKVSTEVQQRFSSIPWKAITGTRHRLIHGYDQVNHDILWQIVKNDLPPLATALENAIGQQEKNEQQGLFL